MGDLEIVTQSGRSVTLSESLAWPVRWTPAEAPAWTNRDFELSERTRAKLVQTVPPETLRAYERWWTLTVSWCASQGRVPLPMTDETLTEWVRTLTDAIAPKTGQKYGVSALRQAVAAIKKVHTLNGYEGKPELTYAARQLVKAHGKELSEAGRRTRKSAVMDEPQQWLDVLALEACDPATLVGLRNRLLVVWSLNLWTRRSELARLNLVDVREVTERISTPDGPAYRVGLDVFFRSSKTDQAGAGTTSKLAARADELCPVEVWRLWRAALAARGIVEGRVVRGVDRWGNLTASYSGSSINRVTQELVEAAGYLYDENGRKFTAHGWRASGYSAAERHGASREDLHEAGRWSPESKAAEGYGRSRGTRGGAMASVPLNQASEPATSDPTAATPKEEAAEIEEENGGQLGLHVEPGGGLVAVEGWPERPATS
ncbi:hypothetical protein [Streptomyces sp. NBC_00207]|uniref:hypothetical protein n=1 Tax=unclassified Streptomyces TaxID=2593676 RepID=UPI002884FFEB|nr:hypothetical protein [Streptomyces sp. DSM 41633]